LGTGDGTYKVVFEHGAALDDTNYMHWGLVIMCNDKNDLGSSRGSADSKYYYIDFYLKDSYFEHRYYGGPGVPSNQTGYIPLAGPVVLESGYQHIDNEKCQVQKTSTSKNPMEGDHVNARIYMKVVIDSTKKSENKEVELQFYEDSAFTTKFATLWMGNASTHSAMNSDYRPTPTGVNRIKIWDEHWRNQPLTMKIYQPNTFPQLTFDGYNKLTLSSLDSGATSNVTFNGNTYSMGTATNIYIEDTGTYEAESKSANTLAFTSKAVGAVASTMASFELDNTIYGTVQSGHSHGLSQGGYGVNTMLNADGTRLLVTDPLNHGSGRGQAHIYHLENGSWVRQQTWTNPYNTGQRFTDGACMNEDGTRIFLMDLSSNKVYTYEYAYGAWNGATSWTHQISPGTCSAEYPGLACNKAGDVLIIGQGNAHESKIYRRASATSWSQDSGGTFTKGRGVAMNGAGTKAFVGHSDGKIYETEWDGSAWSSLTEIINSGYSSWPCTMMSDSAGETLVVVSGNNGSPDSGIYERASNGTWSRVQGVDSNSEIYGPRFPCISYDGTMVLVGNNRYHQSSYRYGRAYLWQKSGGTWSLTKTFGTPDATQ